MTTIKEQLVGLLSLFKNKDKIKYDTLVDLDKHVSDQSNETVFPQVQISIPLGELLAQLLKTNKLAYKYIHLSIFEEKVKSSTWSALIDKNLQFIGSIYLLGVMGTSAIFQHPTLGKLYPGDKILKRNSIVFIIRNKYATKHITGKEVLSYWVVNLDHSS